MAEQVLASGNIAKMQTSLGDSVSYQLPIGDQLLAMNPLIGQHIALEYKERINCTHCGRLTKKSFNQGYCYPCFQKLAQCDSCIVSPEKCHYHLGTCREPEWGETHCMIDHVVYLANSSGLKVGITRETQIPTRWMDQGAVQAIPMLRVKNRYLSGLSEVAFKDFVADKTQWQAMLKNHVDILDMPQEREKLLEQAMPAIEKIQQEYGVDAVRIIDSKDDIALQYPVSEYPTKVTSFNLDKTPRIGGKLMGIKGQYLIFDSGVINLRKYTGYWLDVYQQ